MTLRRIAEILDAAFLVSAGNPDIEIQSVCSSDLMSDLLHFAGKPKSLLITGLINNQVVRTAEIADIHAVVFVLNKKPDRDTVSFARDKGIWLLSTRLSRFSTCGRLYEAGLRSCTQESAHD